MNNDDDILKVKINIKNMIDFNNYLQTQGNTKILNAFCLLSLSDDKDLGLQIGLNLLCGSFWALGGPFGAVGAISANFLGDVGGAAADGKAVHNKDVQILDDLIVGLGSQTVDDKLALKADPSTAFTRTEVDAA